MKVGILGAGSMGCTVIGQAVKSQLVDAIVAYDIDETRARRAVEAHGVSGTTRMNDVLDDPAVKPVFVTAANHARKERIAAGLLEGIGNLKDVAKVTIVLDRGDGLRVRLTTPLTGWLKLTAEADPKARAVSMNLHGEPTRMPRTAHELDLPGFEIEVFMYAEKQD